MDKEIDEATADLIAEVAKTGAQWVKGLGQRDWRRNLVSELRSRNLELMTAQKVGNLKNELLGKIRSENEFEAFPYFVARPRGPADAEFWVPAFGIEARANKDKTLQLGFHVIFFGMPQQTFRSFGHRFDSPEGEETTHNYYHVQPLRGWRNGMHIPGSMQEQPDTFPTFPLRAQDSLDLALHAVHVACGPKLIEELCRSRINDVLKDRAIEMSKTVA